MVSFCGNHKHVYSVIWVIVNIIIIIEDDDVDVEDGASDVDSRVHEIFFLNSRFHTLRVAIWLWHPSPSLAHPGPRRAPDGR